ncbi:uncharacterized protein KGF55_005254 [Candida pseudojiufengensis]|uniref:uncharacterized protein n=1 Tax=Candida pseudojiufengensis TaxID=497109 RepID=UPI002225290F|nr:uncharacterized protein KGF55_005254 [Candida pseudojiufengensis]KAI5959610.1 hypothetical protein KGF55_005254 [Candida pseudojiufengensis]
MKTLLIILFYIFSICLANTETILIKIPNYYNIPILKSIPKNHETIQIEEYNSTLSIIQNFPINTIDKSINRNKNVISLNYNTKIPIQKTLLVKINNYNNSIFQNNDLLNIKLCWPATLPYDFKLNEEYLVTTNLYKSEEKENPNELDLYLRIDYEFFGKTYDPIKYLSENDQLKFQLFISKLPNRYLPIPLELYDFVLFVVDMVILIITQFNLIRYMFGL